MTSTEPAGRASEVHNRRRTPSQMCREGYGYVSTHALETKRQGDSEVERVIANIEKRQTERVVITFDVRVVLLEDCCQIAIDKNYEVKSKIPISDLLEYRDRVKEEHEKEMKRPIYHVLGYLGFRNQNEQLIRVLDGAVQLVASQGASNHYFYYMDFNAYYTRVESRWPWQRNGIRKGLLYVLLFYAFTPIFFCAMVNEPGVCPKEAGDPHAGWTAALYFASTTLSTVGYGDLTVNLNDMRHVFSGILFMIAANITLICFFAVAVDAGWNPLSKIHERIASYVLGEVTSDTPLHVKLGRLKCLRITEICLGFIILNLVGVFANRLFLLQVDTDELETDWTWMVSIYWAVQTTTTIGYGDLDQPENQRWFQIIYLVFSTYFVGNVLGGLKGLREELEQIRRECAWGRREVSKSLIDELQPEGHDGKIDQYEFLVASLVQLGKISSEDVTPIMDKYRSLAGDSGYISVAQLPIATNQEIQEATDQAIQDAIDEHADKIPFTNSRIRAPSFMNLSKRRVLRPGLSSVHASATRRLAAGSRPSEFAPSTAQAQQVAVDSSSARTTVAQDVAAVTTEQSTMEGNNVYTPRNNDATSIECEFVGSK